MSLTSIPGVAVIVALASLSFAGAVSTLRAAELHTIEGGRVSGQLVALGDGQATLRGDDRTRSVKLEDVSSIDLAEAEDPAAGKAEAVATAAGGFLRADALRIVDGQVRLVSPLLGEVAAPLGTVRWVYLPRSGQTIEKVREKLPETDTEAVEDRLFLQRADRAISSVAGVLVGLDKAGFTFRWRDSDRTIKRDQVVAVRLAAVGGSGEMPAGMLVGRTGCRVPFTSIRFDGEAFDLRTAWNQEVRVPLARVAEIRLYSKRLTRLTALTPTRTRHVPFFQLSFPPRMNRSALGRPLKLDGETYAKGLGLHSLTEITYDIGGDYETFLARAGIADEVRPAGSATISLIGDGKPLGEPVVVEGSKPSVPLRFDVSGVDTLMIRVDFGPDNLGAGDHVNIVSPRLVK